MPSRKKAKAVTAPEVTETVVQELPLSDGAVRSMNLRTTNKAGSMVVTVSTGNDTQTAMQVKGKDDYVLKVKLNSSERFSLKPMVITSGILKGRQVLVLEPDQTPTTSVSFLSLPPEVRNLIYSALLVRPSGGTYSVTGNQFKHVTCHGMAGRSGLGLFRANRQIYQEAATVYYGLNRFNFHDTTTLFHYLTRIGSSAKYLRHVEVDGITKSSAFKAGKLLAAATNLELLRLSPHGHGSYLTGHHQMSESYYVISAFKPVFDALQRIKNDREKVFGIVRAYKAENKCYLHRIRPDDPLGNCGCLTTEQFLAELKSSFKLYVKDKDVDGKEIPEPVVPGGGSLLTEEEEDLINYSYHQDE